MKYKHVFFDLDHTLWDFENNSRAVLKLIFEQNDLARSCGIECFEHFRDTYEMHNERFWDRYQKGYIKREELRWKRMWHTLLDFNKNDITLTHHLSNVYIRLLPGQRRLMPFAKDILEHCTAKGYELHMITNGYETVQWQKIKASGIAGYFKHVITSENSMSMKPKPEIFNYALKKAGAQKEESIMIGDALDADIKGAKGIDMDQVFYNYNKKKHGESPTYEITCLSTLKSILK